MMRTYKFLVLIFFICKIIYAQNFPADFKLVGSTGGAAPWSTSETITILSNGEVNFFKYQGGNSLQILIDTNFSISSSQLQNIWQSIQSQNFFL